MNVEVITGLVSNLGFPAAMVCYFAWYNVRRDEQHSKEVSKLTQAVNNNTIVMEKLISKLDI